MTPSDLWRRYAELQSYLGWDDADRQRVVAVGPAVCAHLPRLVADFYAEIRRHPSTMAVITEGTAQIERLKGSLHRWLTELFGGKYDRAYVESRWMVGLRHAEIGLYQVYTNVALARLRWQIQQVLRELALPPDVTLATSVSLHKLLDLDLAIIEDSYEYHRMKREKLAERERSERKFRNLVEAAACMIVILRDDGTVAYFSPFGERLTGFAAGAVVGKDFRRVFVESLDDAGDRRAWSGRLEQLPQSDLELPIHCRDGASRWLAWNMIRLEDFDGECGILAVGHDITEKRQAAQRLLQAERLAAIGQTITGLAHESRNALQRINSCTEMLEFELEDNPDAMQLIRRSQQAQDDLTRLFDEVRNFAAPISLERTPCALRNVWREAWQLLAAERKGRDAQLLDEEVAPELTGSVDRFRMVQVFRNLFENSLSACADPVRIAIHCRLKPQATTTSPDGDEPRGSGPGDSCSEPSAATELSQIVIHVLDNGPGLDPRARREVFQPFFTTKAKGTGLGMAIAQRILTAHGGTLAVGDSQENGAEFVLVLPRNES